MKLDDFLNWESIRKDVYARLAECYSLPDSKLSIIVKELELFFQTLNAEERYQPNLLSIKDLDEINIDTLKVDFSRLFVGPYSLLAPPYGSVYLEGKRRLMEDSTMDILLKYADAGLKTSEDFNDIPDHIRAELEFMHYHIIKEIGAAYNGDTIQLTGIVESQRAFLENHLCAWISDFADNVAANAQTSFYRKLARTTEAFVNDDHRTVVAMLNALQPAETSIEREVLQQIF